jgi:hypothetical protein
MESGFIFWLYYNIYKRIIDGIYMKMRDMKGRLMMVEMGGM